MIDVNADMYELFRKKAEKEANYAIAFALMEVARMQRIIGKRLADLGFGDGEAPGAIEGISMALGKLNETTYETGTALADAVSNVSIEIGHLPPKVPAK